jgi:hypothetical protein
MKIRGNTITVQQISLAIKGGIMKGALDMANNILKGIPAPTEDDHATNKKYVDYWAGKAQTDSETNSKKYADSLTFTKNVTLAAANWVGETAPYTQSIDVEGISAEDNPHYGPVYSGDQEARIAQKVAFAMVDDLDTKNGIVTFTCFEDKPEVDIPVLLEVNR